jgi:hypothetical protein
MNDSFSTHTIGDATSVTSRFGSENGIVRPERLLDVLCFNSSGGTLYMQVFEITNSLIPKGTAYAGGGTATLAGLTAGHTYAYIFGANDTNIINNGTTILAATGAGTFVAGATSITLTGTGSALITTQITDLTVPNSAQVPSDGAVPKFAFPVQAGLGGTLGGGIDMTGIYCCWSSTAATKTIAAASGSIAIVIRG